MTNHREQKLLLWLSESLDADKADLELSLVSGDASFRRYFRVVIGNRQLIAVDSPPEHEDSATFIRVDQLLAATGVHVPEVVAADLDSGFMLLEDLGDELYLQPLLSAQERDDIATADALYKDAIEALVVFQEKADKERLGPYDRNALRREMALFDDWFCCQLLNITLGDKELELIHAAYTFLEDAALAQPTVFVHRDYHSRNLLRVADNNPGIIDFQDAVNGPYSYDLVSLLRDCYISWPQAQIDSWGSHYLELAQSRGIAVAVSAEQFARDLDLMGLQRHLKVMGIFSRLFIRDNKSRYLADIPLVIHYFLEVSSRYSELSAFRDWFEQSVLPLARKRLDLEAQ
jgi:aminoglycoside/choline kinase family phosphotransferase